MYTHYGEKVLHQFGGEGFDFEEMLDKSGMEYGFLPVFYPSNKSIAIAYYIKDGVKKYAVWDDMDVYMTEKIPEDCDWIKLIEDVKGQMHGEEPQKLKSRFAAAVDLAVAKGQDTISKRHNYDPMEIMFLPEKEENEIFWIAKYELIDYGYSVDYIKNHTETDANEEYVEKILKSQKSE